MAFGVGAVAVTIIAGILTYLIRSKIRGDRLRRAIAMEINNTTPVSPTRLAATGPDAMETPIIDANLDKIHLLKEEEVVLIGRYHNYMANLREYNKRVSPQDEISIARGLQENAKELANNTTEELLSNTWDFLRPIKWVQDRFKTEERTSGMTDEEYEKKKEELIEKTKSARERAETQPE